MVKYSTLLIAVLFLLGLPSDLGGRAAGTNRDMADPFHEAVTESHDGYSSLPSDTFPARAVARDRLTASEAIADQGVADEVRRRQEAEAPAGQLEPYRAAVRMVLPRPLDAMAPRVPEVRITALLFVGVLPGQTDEFVEFTNVGTLPLDLSDALINLWTRGKATRTVFHFPIGFVMDPITTPVCRVYTGPVPPDASCALSAGATNLWPDTSGSVSLMFPTGGSLTLDQASYSADPADQAMNELKGVHTVPPTAIPPRAAASGVVPEDCTAAEEWASGRWGGGFAGAVERRWAGDVSNELGERFPGQWAAGTYLQGGMEIVVRGRAEGEEARIEGAAGAVWWAGRWGSRDGSIRNQRMAWGHLSGGVVLATADPPLRPGARLAWQEAAWRPPPGAAFSSYSTIGSLHGDGRAAERAADMLMFTVEITTCDTITGSFDATQVWYSDAADTADGSEMSMTTATGTFRLTRR
jgi:hypothetical protein